MTSLRKLAVAVALAATLPSAALAKPCDHDDAAARPLPAPAVAWRGESPRERELREVRRELRELERTRQDFYARWGGHPGKARRFERWYASRRAELEARRDALHGYAWR